MVPEPAVGPSRVATTVPEPAVGPKATTVPEPAVGHKATTVPEPAVGPKATRVPEPAVGLTKATRVPSLLLPKASNVKTEEPAGSSSAATRVPEPALGPKAAAVKTEELAASSSKRKKKSRQAWSESGGVRTNLGIADGFTDRLLKEQPQDDVRTAVEKCAVLGVWRNTLECWSLGVLVEWAVLSAIQPCFLLLGW